ncbi:response regulator [Litoreibacter janthinus]|uniref:Two component transcriptional regulator, LuxR family n=1 Tax=Litoreibacter janthinus TaxID=670154 RepID=A0A1I6GUR7_9RHOB|nr:response regulator transcription factor [Litoreibacter janthinus]SFR45866.1 two component transcriptional regulator, LuxR family [Litoreibacter janthinus]
MTPHGLTTSEQLNSKQPQGWALVIDDHPLFCDALELTLKSVAAFSTVVTADCLEAALERLEGETPPSLILLDLNLPDVSGLDGLIRLRRRAEKSPIIIVSSMTDNSIINGAIVAGASGFVPKHSRRSVFKEAIEHIAAGMVYKPASFVEGNASAQNGESVSRLSSLTNQQARILDLICEGKLNKQIAYDLTIAETTVKAHVTAIMRKLGVQSRTQAVLVAQDAKFASVLPSSD